MKKSRRQIDTGMTWLLFMDESGNDHKNTPLEVRGGIAVHVSLLSHLITAFGNLKRRCFGLDLADIGKYEIKGSTLLKKKRFRDSDMPFVFTPEQQRQTVREFLTCPRDKRRPTKRGFCAYGRACYDFVDGVFDILEECRAQIFAASIPRDIQPPEDFQHIDYLRKDHVFLFERYFYHLEAEDSYGLLVMDETDKTHDRRFVMNMTNYFTKTDPGKYRANRIVPMPFFVASDMAVGIEIADIVCYVINWGFRPTNGMFPSESRQEIAERYGQRLSILQYEGEVTKGSKTFYTYGICHVPNPYHGRNGVSNPAK